MKRIDNIFERRLELRVKGVWCRAHEHQHLTWFREDHKEISYRRFNGSVGGLVRTFLRAHITYRDDSAKAECIPLDSVKLDRRAVQLLEPLKCVLERGFEDLDLLLRASFVGERLYENHFMMVRPGQRTYRCGGLSRKLVIRCPSTRHVKCEMSCAVCINRSGN